MAQKKKAKPKVKANAAVPIAQYPENVTFKKTPGNPYYEYCGGYAALDAG